MYTNYIYFFLFFFCIDMPTFDSNKNNTKSILYIKKLYIIMNKLILFVLSYDSMAAVRNLTVHFTIFKKPIVFCIGTTKKQDFQVFYCILLFCGQIKIAGWLWHVWLTHLSRPKPIWFFDLLSNSVATFFILSRRKTFYRLTTTE
jgi:hypothetical protein